MAMWRQSVRLNFFFLFSFLLGEDISKLTGFSAAHSHHGDLTAAHPSRPAEEPLLHTIQLKDSPDAQTAAELRERLELGAGGAGVIGRMLSVVDGGREIGSGVIGWN